MSRENKMSANENDLAGILDSHGPAILAAWMDHQSSSVSNRGDLTSDPDLKEQSQRFLNVFLNASKSARSQNVQAPEWTSVRDVLSEITRSRAKQGYSASETASFIFSLKRPLLELMQKQFENQPEKLVSRFMALNDLLDQFGLVTMESFQKSREEIIIRQQEEMLELSTPVVKLWDGILALPVIGTLDSARTQVVMESLLQQIVQTGSTIAIIDITGVPTVDTLVAQHLLKTVAAARLMGADCIISGIRPQIAATIVHLGVELHSVITKATLADAFGLALRKAGLSIGKATAAAKHGQGD
jgi:rsbT co-antagonist protein RsbR